MEVIFQGGESATLRAFGMGSMGEGDCRLMFQAMGRDIVDGDGALELVVRAPRRNQHCNQAEVEVNCNVLQFEMEEREAMMVMMLKVIMFHTPSVRLSVLILTEEQAEALWSCNHKFPKYLKVLVSEVECAAATGSLVLEEKESDVVDRLAGKNYTLLNVSNDKVEGHESRDAGLEEPCLETTSMKHEDGMCVSSIRVPAPLKIICSPRTSHAPVSTRYPNAAACLGLGITALLHDHASSTTDESRGLSPAAIAVSSRVRNFGKPVHLSATFDVKLLPQQPSSQSGGESVNEEASCEAKKSPIPPPPPLPQLPLVRCSAFRALKAKPSNKAASVNDPPRPPPLPPLLAKQANSPQFKPQPDHPSTSPPPPPPPKVTLPPPPVPPVKGILTNRNVPPVPGPPRAGLMPRSRIQAQPRRSTLKPYHWLKLTRATQGSIWAEAQNYPSETSMAPEFDMSELESLFSAAAAPSSEMKGIGGAKSKRRVSGVRKSEKVQLIELRRAYNCEIMLTKVKIPLHDLMSSILELDDSVLDVDQVDSLVKFCPTKEEMELLKSYRGEKESLGKCEKFFIELMKVPRVESKLRVFSFKMQFSQQVSDLRRSLNVVNSAAEEIRSSVKLKRIMQSVLSLGNAVNQGTARGSAVGFRLDSLLKLADTRSRDNKMTLMHYLCKTFAEKMPELLDFSKDLVSLEAAAKVQLKYLAEEMQAITKGLEKVGQELAASEKNDGAVSEHFCKITSTFLSYAEREVKALCSLYSIVGRNVDALALYFGEDPIRCPFEQVVSTLLNFERMFARAHEENVKRVELERRRVAKDTEKHRSNIINGDSLRVPAADVLQSIRSRYIR